MDGARELVHGTAIAIGGRAALIRGTSGAGKSDLALRCLGLGPSALLPGPVQLVSDDQVVLVRQGLALRASAPEPIRGLLEVRGIGILNVGWVDDCELRLVVDLVADGACERLPERDSTVAIAGVLLPRIAISPFEASAPLKLALALSRTGNGPATV